MRAMTLRPTSLTTLQNGATALSNMILNHAGNIKAIGRDALPVVVKAMLSRSASGIHFSGVTVLAQTLKGASKEALHSLRECQDLVGSCGGISALVRCLEILKRQVGDARCWASLVDSAYTAIDIACAGHTPNQDLCVSEGVISRILRLMAVHKDDEKRFHAGPCVCCIHQNHSMLWHGGIRALQGVCMGHEANTVDLFGRMKVVKCTCACGADALPGEHVHVHEKEGAKDLNVMTAEFIETEMEREVSVLRHMYVCMYRYIHVHVHEKEGGKDMNVMTAEFIETEMEREVTYVHIYIYIYIYIYIDTCMCMCMRRRVEGI
jgi:hypothetical protein